MPSELASATKPVAGLPDVPGYVLGDLVHRSAHSEVYRAVTDSGDKVIVKVHRAAWPSVRQLAVTRFAYDTARELDGLAGTIAHLALVPIDNDLALVTADIGARSLNQVLRESGALDLPTALRIAISAAEALSRLHDAGLVHNDVKPANLLIGPEPSQVTLIDFEHAARLSAGTAESVDHTGGSLGYISPEQTGRVNRAVDTRSDLYALGVISFEMLTGQLPFQESDPMELVYAHIARRPPLVADLAPEVPALIGTIVATLLAKNAEDRYRSALGLAHDLRRALQAVEVGIEPNFKLRMADVGNRLVIPDMLYGRAAELSRLHTAFERAAAGEAEALFVAGYAGVGKSRLVNEVQPWIVQHRGWFAAGKFDRYRRDLPYLGWIGVLRDLVRQALVLPKDRLELFTATLLTTLAGNGAVLTEVEPEVELLLGPQPPLPEVSPGEAQARFRRVFRRFITCFAGAPHPLVIFLDDLQWSDLASLDMLEVILTDPQASHMLIVGAWRDNEVGADHPLQASLRHLADAAIIGERIDLAPLAAHHVHSLISDTLVDEPATTETLASLTFQKTGGNPFFLRQFIEALHRDGLITFDPSVPRWKWDTAAIESRSITDNVAELMASRIAALPGETRQVLELASCIGTIFDLDSLATVSEATRAATARALDVALSEGLIVALDTSHRLAATVEEGDGPIEFNTRYGFLHDRVQEAAHGGMDSARRARLHLRIGRLLLARAKETDLDERAVDIASHLLQAVHLITDESERLETAGICLRAGRRAKASMAVAAASTYLSRGLELVADTAWTTSYSLALALHTEAADVAYIGGRFDEIDPLAKAVLDHSRTPLERVPIHNIRIGVGVAQAHYAEATAYAVEVLKKDFGISLPDHPTMGHVVAGLVRLRLALRRYSTDDLLALPAMEDLESRAAMEILMKTATNAYWAVPNLVPLIAFRMCRLSLEKGNIGLSAYGYALFGMISAGAVGDVSTGYAFGQLAMDLLAKTGDRHLVGKTALLWHGFIRHARDPLRQCAAGVLDAYHEALDAGDVENAVYCGTVAYYTDLLGGRSVRRLSERYEGYVKAMLASGQEQTIYALQVWLQVVANLSDPARVESVLVGDYIDFNARLADLLIEENGNAIPQGVSGAGFLAFLLDDMERAEHNLGLLWEYRKNAPGQTFLGPCLALYAVTLIRKERRGSANARDRIRLRQVLRDLHSRARRNPHDFAAFETFVAAEEARTAGKTDAAMALFHDAASVAESGGFTYLQALALELAAQIHRERGHGDLADELLGAATAIWRRYGAVARLRLLGDPEPAGLQDEVSHPSADHLAGLDVRTLLDTVHAISGEIHLDRLMERVLQLALRNAGARQGMLVLAIDDELTTATAATVADDGSLKVESGAEVDEVSAPTAILDYVARTRRAVILDDASTHELFARTPYVLSRGTRSVLCTPLERTGELVGLLYLENDLGVGVFTEQHLGVVATIVGQAAVSVENARLFEHQRAQAEAFARFVPRPFLEQLNRRDIVGVELGDAVESDLCILFSDLRGFTTLSEQISMTATFKLLNEYLACMAPLIHSNHGFVDKYIGDSIMALFVGGADGAVAAAVAMQRALRDFNREQTKRPPLIMGIGIHAGPTMLGTVGSHDRMETTVIGDTVNTASRLEGMTKPYAAPVLISGAVRARLTEESQVSLREVGKVMAKGKTQPITVYDVIDARPPIEAEQLRATRSMFTQAMERWYAASFGEAAELFASCALAAPLDTLAASYRRRSEALLAEGVDAGWDGIDVHTVK